MVSALYLGKLDKEPVVLTWIKAGFLLVPRFEPETSQSQAEHLDSPRCGLPHEKLGELRREARQHTWRETSPPSTVRGAREGGVRWEPGGRGNTVSSLLLL